MYTRDRETISTMLTNHIASERDSFRKQRDELINDMADIKRKAEAFDEIKKVADIEKSKGKLVYDNVKLIARLSLILKEMEGQ